jgi:hypothetical protein
MFEIPESADTSPRRFTHAVLQAAGLLGMYDAELARVLGLMCGDIGRLSSARDVLAVDSIAGQRATMFLRVYRALYRCMHGDGAAMCHWLRATHTRLDGSPLLAMVDHGRLAEVVRCATEAKNFIRSY